jgi:hypothetical protein
LRQPKKICPGGAQREMRERTQEENANKATRFGDRFSQNGHLIIRMASQGKQSLQGYERSSLEHSSVVLVRGHLGFC